MSQDDSYLISNAKLVPSAVAFNTGTREVMRIDHDGRLTLNIEDADEAAAALLAAWNQIMPRPSAASRPGPYRVSAVRFMRDNADIERDGKYYMTITTRAGAERLAAILNDVVALAQKSGAIGTPVDFQQKKIAWAVASALGCRIESSREPLG